LPSLEPKKLCALVGFYMDFDAGERLLNNLEKYRLRSYWIDSRVTNFPRLSNDPNDNSNDGLRELIIKAKYATLIDTPSEPEPAGYWTSKFFQEMGNDYDFILNLGCDEYISGDLDLLMENLIKMNINRPAKIRIPIIEHNPDHNNNVKHITERIIAMSKHVYIKNIHWCYYHNFNGKEEILDYSPLALGITINHDDTIRPEIRNKIMDIYQRRKTKQEHNDFHAEISKVNNTQTIKL